MSYLTPAEFRTLTVMPSADVDDLEGQQPGFLSGMLEAYSRTIDARLRKRYAVPFAEPFPEIIRIWLARMVTIRCYLRRGVDPRDPQIEMVQEDANAAALELKEAADSRDGLWDLPLRADSPGSAVSAGSPLFYAEASPWDWTDRQRELVNG